MAPQGPRRHPVRNLPLSSRTGKAGGPPAADMLKPGGKFATSARAILRAIHEDYLMAAETDGFLKSMDVRECLTQDQIAPQAAQPPAPAVCTPFAIKDDVTTVTTDVMDAKCKPPVLM